MTQTKWFDATGWFQGEFPEDCIEQCHHQGACDADVARWRAELDFIAPRELAIPWLREFGAWDIEELSEMSDEDISNKVLWLACADIQEQGEWLGLVH